jgi:hypothetical protein
VINGRLTFPINTLMKMQNEKAGLLKAGNPTKNCPTILRMLFHLFAFFGSQLTRLVEDRIRAAYSIVRYKY